MRLASAKIACRAEAAIGEFGDSASIVAGDIGSSVVAAIGDHDDFEVSVTLGIESFKGGWQKFLFIPCWDYNGNHYWSLFLSHTFDLYGCSPLDQLKRPLWVEKLGVAPESTLGAATRWEQSGNLN